MSNNEATQPKPKTQESAPAQTKANQSKAHTQQKANTAKTQTSSTAARAEKQKDVYDAKSYPAMMESIKQKVSYDQLFAKDSPKATICSLASNAILTLSAACEIAFGALEAADSNEKFEFLLKRLNKICNLATVISPQSNVATIKKYLSDQPSTADQTTDMQNVDNTQGEATKLTFNDDYEGVEYDEVTLPEKQFSSGHYPIQQAPSQYAKYAPTNPNKVLHKQSTPPFSGTEGEVIFTWLHYIKTILKSNQVCKDTWISMVLPHLKKGALDLAINFTLHNSERDWDKFERLLLRTYEPPNYQMDLRKRLKYIKQGKRSVLEYNQEFINLVNRIHEIEISEADKIELYNEGINPEIHYAIAREIQANKALKVEFDLDSAMRVALQYEDIVIKRGKYLDQPSASINNLNKINKKKHAAPTENSKGITCFICKKSGHKANVCRSGPNSTQKPPGSKEKAKDKDKEKQVKCFRCNKLGHYANKCPGNEKRVNMLKVMNNVTASSSSGPLLTLEITLEKRGGEIVGTALLDPGSSVSTISKSLAQMHGIKVVKDDTKIKTLNHSSKVIRITEQHKIEKREIICLDY